MKDQHRVGLGIMLYVNFIFQAINVLDRLPYSPEVAFATFVFSTGMLLGFMLLVFKSEE